MNRVRLLFLLFAVAGVATIPAGCSKRPAQKVDRPDLLPAELPDLAEAPIEDMTPPGPPWVGTWQIQSITIVLKGAGPDGGDARSTIMRGGARDAVVGELTVESTAASAGHLGGVIGVLEQQLIFSLVPWDATVTIDGTKWVIDRGAGEVIVYDSAISGDDCVLTFLPSDARNKNVVDEPVGFALKRTPPQPKTTVGNWRMVDVTAGGVMRLDGQCFSSSGGYAEVAINLDIDKRHLLLYARTDSSFSDMSCKNASGGPFVSRLKGYLEESAGGFKLWTQELGNANPMYSEWTTVVPIMGELELTRTNCLPSNLCSSFPTKMTIGPR